MTRRAHHGPSGPKGEVVRWLLKGSGILAFVLVCVELVIHTGLDELVKEKLKDWHDKMKVEVNYESAQQLYVFDVFGNLRSTELVSDLRAVLKNMKDDACRPEWDNNDRVRFRRHCAGPMAAEVARSQQTLLAFDEKRCRQKTLPASDEKPCKLIYLLKQLRRIDSGGQPDAYFVEVRAKVTNNGTEIGTLAQEAFLKKGTDQVLPLKYVPSEERGHAEGNCQDLEALGTKAISPCFKNDSVSVADWNDKFGAGLEKTEIFLTISDGEGKKHEKHTEVRSFSPL
jgi:hypothetical protein